jgi:hypothetical protein
MVIERTHVAKDWYVHIVHVMDVLGQTYAARDLNLNIITKQLLSTG